MKNLIFDISPLAYRCLFSGENVENFKMLGENILRNDMLGHIMMFTQRFKPDKVFHCFDCLDLNWRKRLYNFYKEQRKDLKSKQDVNWDDFYAFLEKFHDELRDNFPFVCLRHNSLEADDIAAHLVRRYSCDTNVIITNDGDYLQLLKYKNVSVHNCITGKKMEIEGSPQRYLELKIMTGDKSDNLPAIRPRIGPETAIKLLDSGEIHKLLEEKDPNGDPCELRRNYERNKHLIDLENTPQELLMSLENLIDDYQMKDTKNLVTYIREHRLRSLMDNIANIRQALSKLVVAPEIPLGQPL